MQSHEDTQHQSVAEQLRMEIKERESFMERLEVRAKETQEREQSKIASEGLDEAEAWESGGVHVRKLEDDPQGILRISIGGGEHLPVEVNYCTFRGPREACADLLLSALDALLKGSMSDTQTETEVPPVVAQTKGFRQDLDQVLQRIKSGTDREAPAPTRSSRERSLAITKVQEAIMWLGMDLKAMREEGVDGCANPYPESYNPDSPAIEQTADNLKL